MYKFDKKCVKLYQMTNFIRNDLLKAMGDFNVMQKKRVLCSFIDYQSLQMKSIVQIAILLLICATANAAYSSAMALQLGYLSAASYQSQASIESWTCSYCKKYPFSDAKVFYNPVSGVQGYAGYSQGLNAVVVVFRGSSNIQNWIVNLDAIRSTYSQCSGCSVHSGFLSAYNLASTAVKSAVQNLKAKYRTARLIVTGHSLGGSLAILCTADLKSLYGNVDLTYTFGQPRVGNAAFAQWFGANNANVFRLIDYADIVPHLPPSNTGFLHSSKQIWYQRGMQSYAICDPESSACSNSIGTTSYSTDDHSLDNYLKLKVVNSQNNSLQKTPQDNIWSSPSIKNLRNSLNWADQQERKVMDILSLFDSPMVLNK